MDSMIINSIFDNVDKMMNSAAIDLIYSFLEDCDNEDITFDIEEKVENINQIRCGASKAVFFFNDLQDYVVKIPFECCCSTPMHNANYGIEESIANSLYDIIGIGVTDSDYCWNEYVFYKLAKHEGIEECFTSTQYLEDFGYLSVYYSERVKSTGIYNVYSSLGREIEDIKNSQFSRSEIIANSHCGIEKRVLAMFEYFYGLEVTEKLAEFVAKYGINDITSANCGIGKDGKIKIYDYSGFYEQSENFS